MGNAFSKRGSNLDFPYAAVGAVKISHHRRSDASNYTNLPRRQNPDGCNISIISSNAHDTISNSSGETFFKRCKTTATDDALNKVPYMVEAFQPLIEGSLKVMEILPHLPFIEDTDTFRNKARECPKDAVRLLLNRLAKGNESGQWRAFIEALENTGYEYIAHLLKGETEEDHTIYKKLLKLFTSQMVQQIYPTEFIDKLYEKGVISDHDKEEVECELRNRGEIAASFLLLDRIPRKLTKWYKVFIDVLEDCGMMDIAREFRETELCTQGHMRSPKRMFKKRKRHQPVLKPVLNDGYLTCIEVNQPQPPEAGAPPQVPKRQPQSETLTHRYKNISETANRCSNELPSQHLPNDEESEIKRRAHNLEQLQKKLENKRCIKELKRMEKEVQRQLDELDSDEENDNHYECLPVIQTKSTQTDIAETADNGVNAGESMDQLPDYDLTQNEWYPYLTECIQQTGIFSLELSDLSHINSILYISKPHLHDSPVQIYSSTHSHRQKSAMSLPMPHGNTPGSGYVYSADSAMFSYTGPMSNWNTSAHNYF